jgi:hypothetical protein
MKLIKIILEGWVPRKHTFNGKTQESELAGQADNLTDFLQAIDRLPDTIKNIRVPINTNIHPTSSDYKVIEPKSGWKQEVKDIVTVLVNKHQVEGKVVEDFKINSFGITSNPTDSFYIQLQTKQSKDFSDRIARGDYGSLD